jgi:ATP-dependent DNA helicase 2 subunit 1
LTQAGVAVEPFFISTTEKPFDVSKFFSVSLLPEKWNTFVDTLQSVLLPNSLSEEDEGDTNPSSLPESISISRIEDLLSQMRFHEVPKRALFSVPFQLAENFTIGIKG